MALQLPASVVFTLFSFVFRYFEVIFLNIVNGSRLGIVSKIIPGYL